MSSGSLKDLTKAINSATSKPVLPLPDDLVSIIHAYLEKHSSHDEADSQRLQDELINIYQSSILDKPSKLAPFLAILRTLKPAIRGNGRLLQWWDKLSVPVLSKLGQEKSLAAEARDTLLDILVYDEDEAKIEDTEATSKAIAHHLLEAWLAKSKDASEEFDDHARYVEGQIQMILLSFGKKRPKDLLTTINQYFVEKSKRIQVLALLCEFIRHQPPHLHQILQTPLFDNLLRCLQKDTSTRVISLAMTALIMCLPHIPSSISNHLPSLFNIYSRMLFWDRQRKSPEAEMHISDDEKTETPSQPSEADKSWDKMSYLLESEDESVPELLHYFTFLYGLYPMNFMSYIRKPQRYLRHANFPGADDLDIQPTEIRQRSEPFRQVHLLHPNFFTMTMESELADNQRWISSEASDVVAECMALYSPADGTAVQPPRARTAAKKVELDSDVPEQPLLSQDDETAFPSRHTSWRNTQSTAVAEGFRVSSLHRKLSQTSQSMPSIADSPTLHPIDRLDSPTLPPTMLTSPSHNQLSDLLTGPKNRSSIYQSLTNDSVASLALSSQHHDSSIHMDAYLASLSRETIPRSPALRPTNSSPSLKVAYLHREIQLLRNDLNFERYLKQQHLSHIGQLRTKQIREARVEAETQNLIYSNRILKEKLELAKSSNLQIKKETEKSKVHSRKWESDLSAKLKVLREEQKKWHAERDELTGDLEKAKERTERLKQLVVSSEARELSSKQKVESVEASLEELERLRGQVDRLTLQLRTYEAGEIETVQAKEGMDAALRRVAIVEMQLRARDKALEDARLAFEKEIQTLKSNDEEDGLRRRKSGITQDLLNRAMADSRARFSEIHKAHSQLLKKYVTLQSAYLDIKEAQENGNLGIDEPLLGGGGYHPTSPIPTPSKAFKATRYTEYETEPVGFASPPSKLDTSRSFAARTQEGRSPVSPTSGYQFQSPYPFSPHSPPGASSHSVGSDSESRSVDGHGNVKPKIKPQSEARVYGRGGVQNIGKKEKDKKEKDKAKEAAKETADTKDAKKDKKNNGLRGIRGFV